MPDTFTSLLEEALDAWADARKGVMAEVTNIPGDHFDFRPTPASRSVAELVQHIVETALMWSGELARPDGDFTRKSFPGFLREYAGGVTRHRTKGALLRVLGSSHASGERQIRKAGELAMLQYVRRFDGLRWTRLTWMQHGIAHEEYHRGQIALYARLLGQVPALTKLIHGE